MLSLLAALTLCGRQSGGSSRSCAVEEGMIGRGERTPRLLPKNPLAVAQTLIRIAEPICEGGNRKAEIFLLPLP